LFGTEEVLLCLSPQERKGNQMPDSDEEPFRPENVEDEEEEEEGEEEDEEEDGADGDEKDESGSEESGDRSAAAKAKVAKLREAAPKISDVKEMEIKQRLEAQFSKKTSRGGRAAKGARTKSGEAEEADVGSDKDVPGLVAAGTKEGGVEDSSKPVVTGQTQQQDATPVGMPGLAPQQLPPGHGQPGPVHGVQVSYLNSIILFYFDISSKLISILN
jgi:hypothetical protein